MIEKGIPENEIAFIHEAETEEKKKELFAKVRAGQVRVLMGSTNKMGAGTNCQDKLIAIHHLDCPWRPADLTQRNRQTVFVKETRMMKLIFLLMLQRKLLMLIYISWYRISKLLSLK